MPRTAHAGISRASKMMRPKRERLVLRWSPVRSRVEGIERRLWFYPGAQRLDGAGADEILADTLPAPFVGQIATQMKIGPTPVIYEDLSLLRTLRDLVNPKIEKFRVDSRETSRAAPVCR
jgi:ribonuclease G